MRISKLLSSHRGDIEDDMEGALHFRVSAQFCTTLTGSSQCWMGVLSSLSCKFRFRVYGWVHALLTYSLSPPPPPHYLYLQVVHSAWMASPFAR